MTRLYDQYHQIWTWRIKIYHKDNKSKIDQLMKSWGQWNIKAVYKYDQLMKVMRTLKYKRKYKYEQLMKVMRTWNIKVVYITFLLSLKLIGSLKKFIKQVMKSKPKL
jgi:hypothetical protein